MRRSRHSGANPTVEVPTVRERDDARPKWAGVIFERTGGVLLSQGVYPQVPSALAGLTAVFGMGTGVTPPLWPPETCCQRGLIPRELQSEHEYREMMFEPSPRPISTGRLNVLPRLHLRPINVMVSSRALLR